MKKILLALLSPFASLALAMIIVSHKHENLPQFDKVRDYYEANGIDNTDTKCPKCGIYTTKRVCLEEVLLNEPEKDTFVFKSFTFVDDNSYLQCVERSLATSYQVH